jgi:hypothetical protein
MPFCITQYGAILARCSITFYNSIVLIVLIVLRFTHHYAMASHNYAISFI